MFGYTIAKKTHIDAVNVFADYWKDCYFQIAKKNAELQSRIDELTRKNQPRDARGRFVKNGIQA